MGVNIVLVIVVLNFTVLLSSALVLLKSLHKPQKGKALIRTGLGGSRVILEGAVVVIPKLHQLEEIDLTLKKISFRQTVYCKDQTTATLEVLFYIRVNYNHCSVQEVATSIGAERTFDQKALEDFFKPKFSQAIKQVAATQNSSTLKTQQAAVKVEVLQAVGTDLHGYKLDDCVLQAVEINNIV